MLFLVSRRYTQAPTILAQTPNEMFNRTLLSMLGTLKDKEKSHWCDFVKPLTHAYNCTKNDVLGFSPYELMFGRRPRLPVYIAFGLPVQSGSSQSHSKYVKNLNARLEESYEIVSKNSAKVAERNKARFDRLVRESTLKEGDHVLVRNLRLRNKYKLADKWEATIYKERKREGTESETCQFLKCSLCLETVPLTGTICCLVVI